MKAGKRGLPVAIYRLGKFCISFFGSFVLILADVLLVFAVNSKSCQENNMLEESLTFANELRKSYTLKMDKLKILTNLGSTQSSF